jgi:hypothetical protein
LIGNQGLKAVTAIIRNAPFFEGPSRVRILDRDLAVKSYQLVVWVSVTRLELPHTPATNLWLHPNVEGQREKAEAPPFHLPLERGGFSVFAVPEPRKQLRLPLPLLGMRALRGADLFLTLDFQDCHLSIYSPGP